MDLDTLGLDRIRELFEVEKNRMYAVVAVTAVIVVLYLSFAIIPKFTEFARISTSERDLRDKIDLVNSRVKRINELKRKLTELRNEQQKYYEQLPLEKDIPELLEELSSKARDARVKILSITPGKLSAGSGSGKYYKEMPVRITAKSGYHQLGHFTSILEQGKRLMVIKGLNIRYSAKTPRNHDVMMLLNAYVSVGNGDEK